MNEYSQTHVISRIKWNVNSSYEHQDMWAVNNTQKKWNKDIKALCKFKINKSKLWIRIYLSRWLLEELLGNQAISARWLIWNTCRWKPEIKLGNQNTGTAVVQWLRCCATNRKVAGSIPAGVSGIFHWHNPSDRTVALGSTQPLTEMSTRNISWG